MIRLLLAALLAAIISSEGFAMDGLTAYAWTHRPVLVFGDSEDPLVRRQVDALMAQGTALGERDMVVVAVAEGRVEILHGPPAALDATRLLAAAGGDGEFRLLLVGKDGTVKLRSETPVSPADLFALVDSMPMRQQEQQP